jgi:hypothetical protein
MRDAIRREPLSFGRGRDVMVSQLWKDAGGVA